MKKNLLFSLIVFACIGCHKDIITPLPPSTNCYFGLCDTSKLEIVWQQPLSTDTSEWISAPPNIYNNTVLFTRSTFLASADTLKFFDSKTGALKSTWADYISRHNSLPTLTIYPYKGRYFFTTGNDVFSIDAQTNKTVWKTHLSIGTGFDWINVQDDYVYHVHQGNDIYNTSSYLVRSKLDVGKWDTVFVQNKIDNYDPVGLQMPSVWISPKGDSVALFQIRYVEFGTTTSRNRTDFVAYNMTQKQTYFRMDSIDKFGTVQLPYIAGNIAYVGFGSSVVCFDLINKNVKWKKNIDGGFGGANAFMLIKDILYVKPFNNTFYALNPETSDEIWSDMNAGSGNYGMAYNDGVLYYSCDGSATIVALNLATRKKIWNEPSPNKYPNKFNGNRRFDNANIGTGGITIDSTAGYLYTSDFYFAMCLKLPKK